MLTAVLMLTLSSSPSAPDTKPEGSGSVPLARFFLEPDRVQIFVAEMPKFIPGEEASPKIGPFLLTSQGIELGTRDRKAVAQAWVAPENAPPKLLKKCMFNPDIALRFWRGKAWVDAVVCFTCLEHIFYDEKGLKMDGGAFGDFSVLSEIAKKTFPQKKFRH